MERSAPLIFDGLLRRTSEPVQDHRNARGHSRHLRNVYRQTSLNHSRTKPSEEFGRGEDAPFLGCNL